MIVYLTAAQVASRTGLDRSTVVKYARRGRFPGALPVKKGVRGRWAIPETAVQRFNEVRRSRFGFSYDTIPEVHRHVIADPEGMASTMAGMVRIWLEAETGDPEGFLVLWRRAAQAFLDAMPEV